MSKSLIPKKMTLKDANDFIAQHHRHHPPVVGHFFSIGALDTNGVLRGVATVGRPVSRMLDDGWTAEVTRLCTDGFDNACSFLYARCAQACKAMGFRKVITYILEMEDGRSLKAAGWIEDGITRGGSWDCPSRPREEKSPICVKRRFCQTFNGQYVEVSE